MPRFNRIVACSSVNLTITIWKRAISHLLVFVARLPVHVQRVVKIILHLKILLTSDNECLTSIVITHNNHLFPTVEDTNHLVLLEELHFALLNLEVFEDLFGQVIHQVSGCFITSNRKWNTNVGKECEHKMYAFMDNCTTLSVFIITLVYP